MLGSADLIAFVPTRDPAKAREFYEQTLGLEFLSADPFALVFNAHGTTLRIANVSEAKDFQPAPFTIVGAISGDESGCAGNLAIAERRAGGVVQGSGRQYPVDNPALIAAERPGFAEQTARQASRYRSVPTISAAGHRANAPPNAANCYSSSANVLPDRFGPE